MKMGKYMEKMMTTDAETFTKYYVLDSKGKPSPGLDESVVADLMAEDYYRYM